MQFIYGSIIQALRRELEHTPLPLGSTYMDILSSSEKTEETENDIETTAIEGGWDLCLESNRVVAYNNSN